MGTFVFGILLVLAGLAGLLLRRQLARDLGVRALIALGGLAGLVLGLVAVVASTAIYVADGQGGVVIVKFGADLAPNRIIATAGEKGPQATVLPPGWHFFYWPWLYDLETVDSVRIPQGKVGVITAQDGLPLPPGEVFAPAWTEPERMLDAQFFLTQGRGHRGPQLTVLPPGQYRYNPRQFTIVPQPVLEVAVGEVAVVKANAGRAWVPGPGEELILVNGTPIVPRDFRGIWREALTPNAYYLHPDAFVVTRVSTTNRIYDYGHEQAITVRTKDGFEFPIDVRVSVKISTQHAADVVARLADPDGKAGGRFTVLEEKVILPLVRAIFRNTAEGRGALEFVNQRSEIEKLATQKLRDGLRDFKVDTDGVFIADIRINETEAGRRLLATQTDREVALQEQATYAEKQRAQQARAEAVRAEEEANQQADQAKARSRVVVATEDAKALIARADGEAEAYRRKLAALDGVANFIRLELATLAMGRWDGSVPKVVSLGDGGSTANESGPLEALIGLMLERLAGEQPPATPAQR